ncbi:MAG TPA: hypothetical protein VIF40_18285 [Methylosinus sp.]|jgi:hypothetical protein|uniref:hypothetical protein n=1 Tax=Methylosinus sp. TaxID=427 RepID=UPI002F9360EC
MVEFDATVRLSDIMQAIVIAGGGLYALAQMRAGLQATKDEIAAVHRRLDRTDEELEKQTTILAQLAKGEARMDGLDRRLTLLESPRVAPR